MALIMVMNILKIHMLLKMFWGKSEITVPQFYKNNSLFEKCYVIHIDGCHDQNSIINDSPAVLKAILLMETMLFSSLLVSIYKL